MCWIQGKQKNRERIHLEDHDSPKRWTKVGVRPTMLSLLWHAFEASEKSYVSNNCTAYRYWSFFDNVTQKYEYFPPNHAPRPELKDLDQNRGFLQVLFYHESHRIYHLRRDLAIRHFSVPRIHVHSR